MGNLLCVHVHAGNIHDTKGGVYTLEKALYHYPTLIGVCADQGYRGTFKNTFEIFHNIKVDISPRIKNEFEIQPVRWVVERTFGWMTWSRRLSKDYEIKTFYQENICIISNLQTLLRRFQLVKTDSKNKIIDELIKTFNIQRSLSHKGCPYDNAVSEATYKIFKTEFVMNKTFNSIHELKFQLSDYVHWFNNFRIHGSLGYLSPVDFKKLHLAK